MSGPFSFDLESFLPTNADLMRGIQSDYAAAPITDYTFDPLSILHANIPSSPTPVSTADLFGVQPYLPSNIPPAGSYNHVTAAAPTPATGSSFSFADAQNAATLLANLARTGVATYASVQAIDAGNPSPYAFQNPGASNVDYTPDDAGAPVPADAAPAGFSLASFTDFSTPYPYIAGGVVLALVIVLTKKKKPGK